MFLWLFPFHVQRGKDQLITLTLSSRKESYLFVLAICRKAWYKATIMAKSSNFPYEHYQKLAEPLTVYYPAGQETLARWTSQTLDKAGILLAQLLGLNMPEIQILLVTPADWNAAPQDDPEEPNSMLPYLTDATSPHTIVIPTQLDPIIGEPTQEKLAFLLYHELAHAFLENDPRPWPEESPLWADEWQLQFAALWLAHQINGQQGVVMKDLHERYSEIFVPEEDGKTPVTIRGFDWYDDTTPEDYLTFDLQLEQFAADLLAHYGPEILPHFLSLYRKNSGVLLSDDVTNLLETTLGQGSIEWLDDLVYF